MANGRQPGPMCQVSRPVEVDDGTMCRMPSPRPGPLSELLEQNACFAPPAPKPGVTIFVIGSPSKDQKYQFQFVQAAECRAKNESTIWLVEKSGYEIYGVSLDYITRAAPPGGYGWITPEATLVNWLNQFKDGTIE